MRRLQHSKLFYRANRGFTLTEMLVAVAVLAVVIVAMSTIFGTSQKVASMGEANAQYIQQAAAIERRIRRDVERMSRDGFLAIQCVGVRNDINYSETGRYLDPDRGPNAEVRCDQLMFFTNGREPTSRFVGSYNASGEDLGALALAETAAARVYIGHGVQLPVQPPRATVMGAQRFDPARDENTSIYPWTYNIELPLANGPDVPLITPPAHEWVLARQSILLGDDDLIGVMDTNSPDIISVSGANSRLHYLGRDNTYPNSAPSLFYENNDILRFDPEITDGRVDIAASELDDVRREVCYPWNFVNIWAVSPGDSQMSPIVRRDDVLDAMIEAYPRAERHAPSMRNFDQMLVNNVLAGHVSDFRVEWTWADGVGRNTDVSFGGSADYAGGVPGFIVDGNRQPWFGLYDESLGTGPVGNYPNDPEVSYSVLQPVSTSMVLVEVEGVPLNGVRRYGAVFGYNQEGGLLLAGDDQPIVNSSGQPIFADHVSTASDNNSDPIFLLSYTPWPTALRITMHLHDTKNKLEGGRELQFVIPIPQNENR